MTRTHFGFATVTPGDKAARVRGVFDSVASRYDVMNDLLSFGLHRVWKAYLLSVARARPGDRVLDIAGGTGDLARSFASRVGPTGLVVHTDINATMLRAGRERLRVEGTVLPTMLCDAERLPYRDESFDLVSVGFGLRNMTDKARALADMRRVLRPGGRLLVLDFSQVAEPLRRPYDWYAFNVMPLIGLFVTGDAESYRYLAESIRMHPDQAALEAMMREAGFDDVEVHDMSAGLVALHVACKS